MCVGICCPVFSPILRWFHSRRQPQTPSKRAPLALSVAPGRTLAGIQLLFATALTEMTRNLRQWLNEHFIPLHFQLLLEPSPDIISHYRSRRLRQYVILEASDHTDRVNAPASPWPQLLPWWNGVVALFSTRRTSRMLFTNPSLALFGKIIISL